MVKLSRQKMLASDSSVEIILEKEKKEEISFSHSNFTTDERMIWVKKDINFWDHINQIIYFMNF
jgi:hypothetical protein